MPTYKFQNTETGEMWEEFMGISEADKYLSDNPHIKKMVNGFPGFASAAMGVSKTKPDDTFRDVLKEMKKTHSQGFTKANINTF